MQQFKVALSQFDIVKTTTNSNVKYKSDPRSDVTLVNCTDLNRSDKTIQMHENERIWTQFASRKRSEPCAKIAKSVEIRQNRRKSSMSTLQKSSKNRVSSTSRCYFPKSCDFHAWTAFGHVPVTLCSKRRIFVTRVQNLAGRLGSMIRLRQSPRPAVIGSRNLVAANSAPVHAQTLLSLCMSGGNVVLGHRTLYGKACQKT